MQCHYSSINSNCSTNRNNRKKEISCGSRKKACNVTQDPDMKSLAKFQLSPRRVEDPVTTKALHETAVRPTRQLLQSSASQSSIAGAMKNNMNKSIAQATNNGVNQSCQSVERAKSSFNASSAFIEAYLVRKPDKLNNKLTSEPSSGEWSTSIQDGKSSVKMIKKGNTFFPAIFKSPTATVSNKQSFTSQIFKMR